jgi:hypothetical protein
LAHPGNESAGRNAPDITHFIGFGILLSAALLIAIGTVGAPQRSGGASLATDGTMRSVAAVDSQGHRH